jgi:amino acid transporter
MYIALGVTTALYVAIALAVFGTLTVDEVIASGETALAKAAEPFLGQAGYTIMAIAALLATSSSVNAGLYPANGVSKNLVEKGQFPPAMARPVRGGTMGLMAGAGLTLLLTVLFDLSAIANLGSAGALLGFLMVSIAHLRVVGETGARRGIILLGALVTAVTFVYFTATTVLTEPPTFAALILTIVLSIVIDFIWKRSRDRRTESHAPAT